MTNHYSSHNTNPSSDDVRIILNPAEIKLIQLIRRIDWGELNQIKVENHIPILVKMSFKTYKLK